MNNQLRTRADKGNRTVSLKQSFAMATNGVDTMWFLPNALNVKVIKFKQARVNGGSNYDPLKVAKCLVIKLVMDERHAHCPNLLSAETKAKGTGLG